MRMLVLLAVLLYGGFGSPSAFAWGDVGHRVICQIAYEELKPEIRARVDALVAIDPKFRTFADACTAPDHPHIRSPEHYVDLPRSAKGIEVAHPCPVADRCVISAILNDTPRSCLQPRRERPASATQSPRGIGLATFISHCTFHLTMIAVAISLQ